MGGKDLYEKDFYKILGVDNKAPTAEIKKKYRALARELHPDKTKGNIEKEEKFKAVSEAYENLSDSKKRAEYDEARSLISRGGTFSQQGGKPQDGDFSDIFGGINPDDIFANLFGGKGRRGTGKGQDLQTDATISFRDSIIGTTLNLSLTTDGKAVQNISVRIPAGVHDGVKIRIIGKGGDGAAGKGDLFVILNVQPHPIYKRKDENLLITLPITFAEAVMGADIKVPTLSGDDVKVRIAPGTPNGRTLRVKGHGVKKENIKGDLLITLEVQVPQRIDGKALEALKTFAKETNSTDVRKNFLIMAEK